MIVTIRKRKLIQIVDNDDRQKWSERERERETLEKITNTQKRSADIIFNATQIKREREVHTRRLQVPFFCYLFFIFLINQNLFCFYFAVERR